MTKLLPTFAMCAMVLSPAVMAAKTAHHASGPMDLAIANETKLIEMLKRSGKIPAQASISQAEAALKSYLKKRVQDSQVLTQDLADSAVEMLHGNSGALHTQQKLNKGKHRRHGGHHHSKPKPLQLEPYTGEVRTAKVLTILMEFPDFPHNSIQPGETDMYYEDYNTAHYEELLFSKDGVTGPKGENLISMIQYYNAQSGGSYSVEGTVAGWYMASKSAAFYGNNEDGDARALIREALLAAAADPTVNLADFDIEDRYDLDGDGNYWEPDGLIDHVQIFHSSVGEEAGGGQLGEDAVWSHRWNLGGLFQIEGSTMAAFDYTIQPADAAAGVVSHEYGHDLGLPDEYDTQYTGTGEPVSAWSVMSSGSWAGILPGSEPTGFSAWSKEFLQQAHGGNWLHGETFDINDLPRHGEIVLLDQAVSKGTNNDAVRIDLPDQEIMVTKPVSGEFTYFSGKGDGIDNSMSVSVDLTSATKASLTFKAWYDIEADWDYAYILVDGETVASSITTTTNPNNENHGNGITGNSNGWIDAEFDLTAYVGKPVTVTFQYVTDGGQTNPGMYVDDIVISADNNTLVADNADADPLFGLDGFKADKGSYYAQHYYLLEWRIHEGVDKGLAHVKSAGKLVPFNQGLIVWYVDSSFDDNWTGVHPGKGFLGVVDADQKTQKWSDGTIANTRYQIHDAAFSLDRSEKLFVDQDTTTLTDNHTRPHRVFKDSRDYTNPESPDSGRAIPQFGLKVKLISQSKDKSVVKVRLYNKSK